MAKSTKTRRRHPKRNRLLTVAVLVFSVYVVIMLAQLQLELNERQAVLEDISLQITATARENEVLQDKLDNYEKYLDAQARQRGLARPGEIVFQEIPGTQVTTNEE